MHQIKLVLRSVLDCYIVMVLLNQALDQGPRTNNQYIKTSSAQGGKASSYDDSNMSMPPMRPMPKPSTQWQKRRHERHDIESSIQHQVSTVNNLNSTQRVKSVSSHVRHVLSYNYNIYSIHISVMRHIHSMLRR